MKDFLFLTLKMFLAGYRILLVLSVGASGTSICQPGQHYDDRTEACESCIELCRSFPEKCKSVCPESNKPAETHKCSPDTFWDPRVASCQPCEEYCPGKHCSKICPEFHNSTKEPTCSNEKFFDSEKKVCINCTEICPTSWDRCAKLCPGYQVEEEAITHRALITASSVIFSILGLVLLMLFILHCCGYININKWYKWCRCQGGKNNDTEAPKEVQTPHGEDFKLTEEVSNYI
ncbi:proprotein convertase subtilisin/kexin type 5-like [Lineus longissimus]|uniref:proprotein convertase subtilisin/kexin type 5-like n=1 Tax=Lineus longissimus TaxID=88925 RepID=UPI00315D321F